MYDRTRITAANGSDGVTHNPTVHVSNDGSDTNDGLTELTAFATIQKAVDCIKNNFDSNGFGPVIKIHDGTYGGWQDYGPMVGGHKLGGGPIVFLGNMGNPMAVAIVESNKAAISYDGYAQAVIVGLVVSAPNGTGIYATNGAIIEIGLVSFGTANAQIGSDDGALIIATSTLRFVQGAWFCFQANEGGRIKVVPGVQVNFDPGIGYAQQVLYASRHGLVSFPKASLTISGNPSGQRWFSVLGGIIDTGGIATSNPTLLPGSVNGSSSLGGLVY